MKPGRASDSVACPVRDGAAVKCPNDNADGQNFWKLAPVWWRPVKMLVFSQKEECVVSHLGTVDQQQSGAALQCLRFLCCCRCESLTHFIPHSATSLTKQS